MAQFYIQEAWPMINPNARRARSVSPNPTLTHVRRMKNQRIGNDSNRILSDKSEKIGSMLVLSPWASSRQRPPECIKITTCRVIAQITIPTKRPRSIHLITPFSQGGFPSVIDSAESETPLCEDKRAFLCFLIFEA